MCAKSQKIRDEYNDLHDECENAYNKYEDLKIKHEKARKQVHQQHGIVLKRKEDKVQSEHVKARGKTNRVLKSNKRVVIMPKNDARR